MRLIVTNNPLVKDYCDELHLHRYYSLLSVEGLVEDVLCKVRDLCHRHHRLITHPLTGSVKPNHSLYKTVVLEPLVPPVIDLESIRLAEAAVEKARSLLLASPRPATTVLYKEDFAVIDMDLFRSYLNSVSHNIS